MEIALVLIALFAISLAYALILDASAKLRRAHRLAKRRLAEEPGLVERATYSEIALGIVEALEILARVETGQTIGEED